MRCERCHTWCHGGIHGSTWDILHVPTCTSYIHTCRTVGQDRHMIDMCGGPHGSPGIPWVQYVLCRRVSPV